MKVGDIVQHHRSASQYLGKTGIITAIMEPHEHNLWPEDNLVEILYADSKILTWNERSVEVVNEL